MSPLYRSESIDWQDKCQGEPTNGGCPAPPVEVWRAWEQERWCWPLCAEHRFVADREGRAEA